MTASDAHRTVEAIWRIESAKLIAGLARIVRDVGTAEELAQDAFLAALERWPERASRTTRAPGSWRPRGTARSTSSAGERLDAHTRSSAASSTPGARGRRDRRHLDALDGDVGDDLLRLCFITCHPVLSTEDRVALTLRLLGGLTTEEIARAFLVPPATVGQRIVRAKRTLAEARVPFEVPAGRELAARLGAVLEVIYLVFNEGYSATAGDDWMRPGLCGDALRLGRILAGLVPEEAEVHGLVALMEIQASRAAARVGPSGEPVLLLDQDRSRWDHLLVRRGLAALTRAQALGGALGPYALQAAIAGCHAAARTAAQTDWARIAALYDALAAARPLPGRRAQPGGRGGDGVRPAGGARGSSTGSSTEPSLRAITSSRQCAATSSPARPPRGGARGVRAGGLADPQRAGAAAPPRPGESPTTAGNGEVTRSTESVTLDHPRGGLTRRQGEDDDLSRREGGGGDGQRPGIGRAYARALADAGAAVVVDADEFDADVAAEAVPSITDAAAGPSPRWCRWDPRRRPTASWSAPSRPSGGSTSSSPTPASCATGSSGR